MCGKKALTADLAKLTGCHPGAIGVQNLGRAEARAARETAAVVRRTARLHRLRGDAAFQPVRRAA